MWKVLIADDEPKIRSRLKKLLNWDEYGMEVVGEAEDGEVALKLVKELTPDIMLVDICMPFLNGLELIEEVKKWSPNCMVIVITGYDEFTYAQQAVKLNVLDYLLKPVVKDQLTQVILKAKERLELEKTKQRYMSWANEQLKKNLPAVRERFFNEWMNGQLHAKEIVEQVSYWNIPLLDCQYGILLIKPEEKYELHEIFIDWNRQLLYFALQNIVEEMLLTWASAFVFKDYKDHLVVVVPVTSWSAWLQLHQEIPAAIKQYLQKTVTVWMKESAGDPISISHTYEELLLSASKDINSLPVVMLAKRYIDLYYHKAELSLQEVASSIGINQTYLSRLLRQELGATFVDYVTQTRVKHAIKLLNDPTVKIYEVAERVGYNGQHYFSRAFKRVMGRSPIEYRKGGDGSFVQETQEYLDSDLDPSPSPDHLWLRDSDHG